MKSSSKNNLILLLSVIGICISAVSVFHYAGIRYGFQTEPSFCNVSATINCDAVNASKYAVLLGVPISSLALFFYSVLFVFSWSVRKREWLSDSQSSPIYIVTSVFSVLFSIYLGTVSYALIKAMCLTCIGLYLVNLLLFIASISGRSIKELPYLLINGCKEISKLLFTSHKNSLSVLLIPTLIFVASFYAPKALGILYKEEANEAAIISTFNKGATFSFIINKEGLNKDAYKGNENAKVKLVEFADFECPACRVFSKTIDEMLEEFKDKILFIHKQFPLDNSCNQAIPQKFHQHACHAAFFVRCAGEQDKYWEAYNYLFSMPEFDGQTRPSLVTQAINNGASKLGMDEEAMKECLESKRHLGKIQSDIKEGMAAGLEGTPTLYINGKKVLDTSKEAIRILITSELNK